MPYESIYVAAVLVSSAIGLAVGLWLWSDDADRSMKLFVANVLLIPVYGLLVVGELLAPTEGLAIVFYDLHSAVGSAVPPSGSSSRSRTRGIGPNSRARSARSSACSTSSPPS